MEGKHRHIKVNRQLGHFSFLEVMFFFCLICVFKHLIRFLFADMREEKLRERTWCRTVGIWLICLEITLIGGSGAVNNTGPSMPIIFPDLFVLILPALSLVSFGFIFLFPISYLFSNVSFLFLFCISLLNFTLTLSWESTQCFGFLPWEWRR